MIEYKFSIGKNCILGNRTLRVSVGKENPYKKPEIVTGEMIVLFLIIQFARYKFLHVFLSREVLSRARRVTKVNFRHYYFVLDF